MRTTRSSTKPLGKADDSMSVLIIDPKRKGYQGLFQAFTAHGYRPVFAKTAAEALDASQKRFFGVVILGIGAANAPVTELYKSLRQVNPDAAVMLVADHPAVETAVWALNNGAQGYFAKPLDSEEVLARVGEAVELQRQAIKNRELFKAARKGEQRYRTIADKLSDYIWIVGLDLKVSYMSPSAVKIRGYTLEEINDVPLEKQFTPESYRLISEIMSEEITPERLAEPSCEMSQTLELEYYKKDGSTVWIEVNLTLIRDADGSPKEILGIGRDITGRKRADEALRESEEKYRALVESANDSIVIVQDGLIVFSNTRTAEMTGYPLKDILGTDFADYIHPDNRGDISDKYSREIAGEKIAPRHESALLRQDGRKLEIEINVNPLTYRGKAAHQVLIRDITERKRAEEALRESNTRLKKVLEVETVGVMFWDLATGLLVEANDTFLKLMGYSRRELESDELTWQKLTPPEYIAVSLAELEKFRESGRVGPYEKEYIRKDGTRQWLIFAGSSLGGDTCVEFCVDVSDRKRAEEALMKSEELFRNLFERDAAVKLIIDPEGGRIVDANEAAAGYYGWPIEQLRKMVISDINPMMPEGLRNAFEKVLLTGQAHFEFKHRRADGTVRDIEAFASLIDVSGRRLIHAIIHDIADRKEAEKAVRESEERFRMFVESAPDAIFVQTDFRFAYLNPAAVRLYGASSADELLGKPVLDRFHPDFHTIVAERIKDLNMNKKAAPSIEQRHFRMDGTLVIVDVSAVPVRYEGKDGALVFVRDITERKKMEQQLLQSEKLSAVGTMISGVAHELNNPLTSIIGNAQLLARRDAPDDIKAKLDVILQESVRSSKIVSGLLAFAREHKPERKMISINDVIVDSLKLREYDLRVSNIALNTSYAENLPLTYADPYQLQQVFINLINNARDAIVGVRDRGELSVTTSVKDNNILTVFADNGPGIDENKLASIFEPFFTTKETGKGTGLGLSVVFGIIKEHSGRISVESKPGQGARFTIMLPITWGEQESENTLLTDRTRSTTSGPKSVLVVDDEESLRDLLFGALTESGYRVDVAANGREAIELLELKRYDAVVSDFRMPDVGGR